MNAGLQSEGWIQGERAGILLVTHCPFQVAKVIAMAIVIYYHVWIVIPPPSIKTSAPFILIQLSRPPTPLCLLIPHASGHCSSGTKHSGSAPLPCSKTYHDPTQAIQSTLFLNLSNLSGSHISFRLLPPPFPNSKKNCNNNSKKNII